MARKAPAQPVKPAAAAASLPYAKPGALRPTGGLRALGAVFLAVSVIASGVLVLEHLAGFKAPGCGPGEGCEELMKGFWGSIRFGSYSYPVSSLGLAYFVAMFVAWLAGGPGVTRLLRWLIRLGVVVSVAFIMVMVMERELCKYCLAAHIGNISFWVLTENSRWQLWSGIRPLAIWAVVFAVATVGLATAEFRAVQGVEGELDESIQAMLHAAEQARRDQPPAPSTTPVVTPPVPSPSPAPTKPAAPEPAQPTAPADKPAPSAPPTKPAAPEPPAGEVSSLEPEEAPAVELARADVAAQQPPAAAPATSTPIKPAQKRRARENEDAPKAEWVIPEETTPEEMFKNGFRGRWLYGPDPAAIRIVMITDYQCPDCKRIEEEIQALLAKYPDRISLSVKLFPFTKSCNPSADRDLHPNGCWAARAAEAAGMKWGNEGFWKMHRWLFERRGGFETTKILEDGLRSMGYEPGDFVKIVQSQDTLKRVQEDIREARALGLFQTPMIFINGIELRGWNATNAVTRAIERLVAANPPPGTHTQDRPPLAIDKAVGDWKANPRRRMPPDNPRWTLGPERPGVEVIVYGDYAEKTCAETHEHLRKFVAAHPEVSYTYRHFPFNQMCNRCIKFTRFYLSCHAARLAEAAGRLAGNDGFWRMHDWLMQNQQLLSEEALREVVTGLGYDPVALFEVEELTPESQKALGIAVQAQADAIVTKAATELGLDRAVLVETMNSVEADAAVKDDVEGADKVSLQAIPLILVNGQAVGRWRHLGFEALDAILLEAAGKR